MTNFSPRLYNYSTLSMYSSSGCNPAALLSASAGLRLLSVEPPQPLSNQHSSYRWGGSHSLASLAEASEPAAPPSLKIQPSAWCGAKGSRHPALTPSALLAPELPIAEPGIPHHNLGNMSEFWCQFLKTPYFTFLIPLTHNEVV